MFAFASGRLTPGTSGGQTELERKHLSQHRSLRKSLSVSEQSQQTSGQRKEATFDPPDIWNTNVSEVQWTQRLEITFSRVFWKSSVAAPLSGRKLWRIMHKEEKGDGGMREVSAKGVLTCCALHRPPLWGRGPPTPCVAREWVGEATPQFLVFLLCTVSGCLPILHEKSCINIRHSSNACSVKKAGTAMLRNGVGSWAPWGLWQASAGEGARGSSVSLPCGPLMVRTTDY